MTRQTRARVWKLLREVIDRVEGDHAGIPECCVEVFVGGRQAATFRDTLQGEDLKRMDAYEYVPCDECFRSGRVVQIRKNGHAHVSKKLLRVMDEVDGLSHPRTRR